MINRKIWIAGSSGNIGRILEETLSNNSDKIFSTDLELDVTNTEEVTRFAVINRPDVIINCACISDIEECEKDRVKAYKVNSLGARNLSSASRQIGATMVQLSTDDVFAGNEERALNEFDKTEPISVYGKSKLAGEVFAKELTPKHIIRRSTWIYGYGEGDFVSEVINAAKEKRTIEAAVNQISSPTSVYALSEFINKVIRSDEYGIFHAACTGMCSRFDYAKRILELSGLSTDILKPVLYNKESENMDSMRPRYTALENLMMEMTGIYEMPDWETALERHMLERSGLIGK